MIKCPESIEELDELLEKLPMCRKDLCKRADTMIESGAAINIKDASRKIAEETGGNAESIRRSIMREREDRGVTLSHLLGNGLSNELVKEVMKNRVLVTKMTGDQESYTPEYYVELSRSVMGSIDTDPASNDEAQNTVKADTYWTINDDGLTKSWLGNVFVNPPYSHGVVNKFVDKLLAELDNGNTNQAILLTNNSTDTLWFFSAAQKCASICFTKGRIGFVKPNEEISAPTNGQAFFYFGENKEKFNEIFSEVGLIMEVVK